MDGQQTQHVSAFERLARSRQRTEQLARLCRAIEADACQLGQRQASIAYRDPTREVAEAHLTGLR